MNNKKLHLKKVTVANISRDLLNNVRAGNEETAVTCDYFTYNDNTCILRLCIVKVSDVPCIPTR
ncbi:MAG: hypothetical protein MUF15_07995 [Acidobacteria bacterium]|jgi:hypothetical protein|nr:hypothetical protein [Acidobacteriota bacterium]